MTRGVSRRAGGRAGLERRLRWLLLSACLVTGVSFAAESAPEVKPPAPDTAAADAADAPPGSPRMTLDELLAAFGWSFDETVIRAQKVADGLYVFFGVGGNIVASIGRQGTLLVDNQFPQLMPKIEAALRNLGGDGAVDFAINSHWHFDHAEGNLDLGPKGTWIVAQERSRERMTRDNVVNLVGMTYNQKAYPENARPHITYRDQMRFEFNGETLNLWHFGPAHTTGDTAVYFENANVVHMGDVFNAGYPFIDVDSGGDVDGVISFCEAVLLRINDDTKVVPGHGPVLTREALAAYIDMLRTVRNRIAQLIEQDASFAKVVTSKPTAEFDERYGADPTMLIDRVYASLMRLKRQALAPLMESTE
ncbi:MAG: MBL fold metallo-hydrolase [Pseudomonadota bacterium]